MTSLSLAARRAAKIRHLAAVTVAASAVVAAWDSREELEDSDQHRPNAGSNRLSALVKSGTAFCASSSPIKKEDAHIIAPSLLAQSKTPGPGFSLRRRATLRRLDQSSTKTSLASKYEVNPDPIGEGAFGQVFVARNRETGELVAVKKIWKKYSNNRDFVKEMSTLLQIRAQGGHPHICTLRENFEEPEHFALVLDLIKGGEMFEYLSTNGAYSELEASRLIREVASALDFLHGVGLVHFDLKPENLMLSARNDSASVKLVDFGCSESLPGFDAQVSDVPEVERKSGGTVAYSPPEAFEGRTVKLNSAHDMWSLGVILHIMLTGVHPFDKTAEASDEELVERIRNTKRLDLKTPDTAHPSASAIDLLSKLLEPNPAKRLQAHEMLQHSWVTGETARSDVIAGSDRRLSKFRRFKSHLETKVFQELMSWSANEGRRDPSKSGESLVEKAFKSLDKEQKGFLTIEDIENEDKADRDDGDGEMSLSAFSDLLGENMQNKYFPRGHVVFEEGDIGEHMYFLNSGACEVITEGGFHAILKHGDTFGEGGLLNENRRRSATIKTLTPVHAIQIDRECFTKYLLGSDSAVALQIKERINKRKFGRAEFIVGQHESLRHLRFKKGETIFQTGEGADAIFFVAEGSVDVKSDGHSVYLVGPGELLGVQSFYMNRPRAASAVCVSDDCLVKALSAEDFRKLVAKTPDLEDSLRELALRREFRRAVVKKLNVSFNQMELREVFDAIDLDKSGKLSRSEVADLLTHLDVSMPDNEIQKLLDTLDLDRTGFVNFEEFTSIFA